MKLVGLEIDVSDAFRTGKPKISILVQPHKNTERCYGKGVSFVV